MKIHTHPLIVIALVAAAVVGCKKSPPAPADTHDHHASHADHHGHGEAPDHAAHTQPETDTRPVAPNGPKIETGAFVLAVSPAQPRYSAGTPGELEIALESRGDWHVNEEYPIRVDLAAEPGVAVPKPELVREDAKEFGEDKVRFVASVEPEAAGEHAVTCDVSFALCTEENCILEKRTLAMTLEVE